MAAECVALCPVVRSQLEQLEAATKLQSLLALRRRQFCFCD